MKEITSTRFVVRLVRADGTFADILKEGNKVDAWQALRLLRSLNPREIFEIHRQQRTSERIH